MKSDPRARLRKRLETAWHRLELLRARGAPPQWLREAEIDVGLAQGRLAEAEGR